MSAEHREAETRWSGLRAALERIAVREAVMLEEEKVGAFRAAYAAHIAFEEGDLLPMAARLPGDSRLDELGRAMRGRRDVKKI